MGERNLALWNNTTESAVIDLAGSTSTATEYLLEVCTHDGIKTAALRQLNGTLIAAIGIFGSEFPSNYDRATVTSGQIGNYVDDWKVWSF